MSNIIVPDDPVRLPWAMTLGELVDMVVSRDPRKIYLYYQDHRVAYEEFREYSLRTARLFRELGVRHGDRVCVSLPNGPEFLYIWIGLSRLGAICVPINTAYKEAETAYILNNAEAKALVSHHSLMNVANGAARQCPTLENRLVVSQGGETYATWEDYWALVGEASSLPPEACEIVSPQDISMLVYTSGTTGSPKGVMITHEMYVAAGQGFATWTAANSEDRFFTCLPYFHANAQYYSTMGSLAVGASIVLADRFSASRFWDQVREAGATVVNFIGMIMPVLLKQTPDINDRNNSVRVFYGSPALSPEVLDKFEERFGAKVLIGFGLTESCYGTIEHLGVPHRQGSCGQARWYPDPRFRNELRIVDNGTVLPSGNTGEITLKSPAVMPGYWRDPDRTREALRSGWLYTGDLGWLDEDGHLYFVDRKKDVVRRRGENISSQEVEDVIKSHPGVMDCAVIAVPSELGEEDVKAYVVPRQSPRPMAPLQRAKGRPSHQGMEDQFSSPLTEESQGEGEQPELKPEDVVYWCAERLAYFKVPRYVELRGDLPRTPSLRVRKDLLRQEREDLTTGCFDREKAGIRLR